MRSLSSIFKAYDVRGIVPTELDEDICRAIGRSFARFCSSSRIVVARDMRESGESLASAFTEGARSAGVDVADLGLASTDMMYFASGKLDLPGAMFTASHNPAAYNGIKFCLAGAKPVGRDSGLAEIRQMAEEDLAAAGNALGSGRGGVLEPGRGSALGPGRGGALEHIDLLDDYAEHVRSFVDAGSLRPLRVVADTANGMGGLVVPKVFEKLPFELTVLFGELDGTFPNHPADPIQPENLVGLKEAVIDSKADVGLAFDGDADRVFLVDEQAEPVSGSLTTALVADAMLAKHPGATVLYNLICSKVVPETIRDRGGTAVRTRVGHSFIKEVMASTGALFGGEHSGHYYFRDNYRADSGIIAAIVVLEVLSTAGGSLSELLAPYRRYSDSGEINKEVPDPVSSVEELARHFEALGKTIDRTDGLTVDLGDWWFNIRPSNTEPLLRLNVEASDEAECRRHTDEVLALVTSAGDIVPRSSS